MYIQVCQLELHENLFYATREIGRLYETGRYLHNYALSYALGLVVSQYFNQTAIPRYESELSELNDLSIYVTPARPLMVTYELNTFKYADNRYRVKMLQGSSNTPSYGRAKEIGVGSRFEFAVLSQDVIPIPRWVRLGKWMSKAEVTVMISESVKRVKSGDFVAQLPMNPLDLSEQHIVKAYDMISMPPVSLLDNVSLQGSYFELANEYCFPADLAYRFPAL